MDSSLPIISSNVIERLVKLYGGDENALLKVMSSCPKTSVLRVNLCHQSADHAKILLEEYLEAILQKKYAKIACKNDYNIGLTTTNKNHGRFEVTQHPILNDVLLVSSNCSEIIEAHSVKEVIVDANCGSAVLRGADIFAPGVLAVHPGMQRGDKVSVYADLEKKCRRGLVKPFEGKKYFLGNGIALYSRTELFENNIKLSGTAVQMTSGCGGKAPHPSFTNLDVSLFFPQNLPSLIVAHVLNARPGDRVLDMCASPGGKTTHVASLLKNQGHVIAIDKTQKKCDRIITNCSNLGLTNVKTFAFDSTKLIDESSNTDSNTQSLPSPPPYPSESFDKILLDPPCSGMGQRPQLHYILSDKELNSYPVYQKKLIKQAVGLLKRGGRLVYSTCTLLPEENEEQVAWLLKNFPNMKLEIQSPYHFGRPGIPTDGISLQDCANLQRFDWCFLSRDDAVQQQETLQEDIVSSESNHHCDTIGFFIAKFVKL